MSETYVTYVKVRLTIKGGEQSNKYGIISREILNISKNITQHSSTANYISFLHEIHLSSNVQQVICLSIRAFLSTLDGQSSTT